MIADEIKNLVDIEIRIMMQESNIRLERVYNSLYEF